MRPSLGRITLALALAGVAARLAGRQNSRQSWMALPDVLQHRLAVVLVAALGICEWLVRTGRVGSPRWAFLFPLLCAAGGGLLLTHSHAMINLKAEFLAEVTHTPLGLLGVFVGWGRWLELRLPPPENRIPGRVGALSMLLLGTLLVFYREGTR